MAGSLIINSPYTCPDRHWQQGDGGKLVLINERRPAGYEIYDIRNNTRRTNTLDLVNEIRGRVDTWRADGYPGITSVTRSLLEHWKDDTAREYPFYFCQIEAIETLIWWHESAPEYRQGIAIPGDGGPWTRLASKMATGTGKTTVMAMIITWQVLNALTYPARRKQFSSAVFVVAPGLTVKERLQVLYPGNEGNYYDSFSLCPSESLRQKLNRMQILVENWHTLMPLKELTRSVVKKGPESDEAFTRRVLGPLAGCKDLVVINDEAHHAYRKPAEAKVSRKQAAERGIDLDEATRWIDGLDRLHKTRRIARCFDLSATPFVPTGKTSTEEALFDWVISDFGLNDAIEAGLVKTPRVVVRDNVLPDSQTYRAKLYHLYRDPPVAEDLNRKAQPHEPLPALVQNAYTLLGADWREAHNAWHREGHVSPPVMLTVCNRTETAARIEHYFRSGAAFWEELHDGNRTLRVDSKVLEKAEIGENAGADKNYEETLHQILDSADIPQTAKERLAGLKKEELLREIVDNVGKRGRAGQDLQNVISVAMLSEGWDAKNVTHIMGLRAFTSQLLCEQVIGRGLRRVGYDTEEVSGDDGVTRTLFRPEYVNVFGVPLSVFEDVGDGGEAPPPAKHSHQVESLPERNAFEIRWPNLLRVDHVVTPRLSVDWDKVEPLVLDPAKTAITADLAPAVGNATDLGQLHEIDLERLSDAFRLQHFVFQAAGKAFDDLERRFEGNREFLVYQLVRLVEGFLASPALVIPTKFHNEPLRRRILLAINVDSIVGHILRHVRQQNVSRLEPVFDEDMPSGTTAAMRTWYTTKHVQPTTKSQINHAVADSTWEKYAVDAMEKSSRVAAYAKNDHLGFHVHYLWNGSKRRYVPDYLVRFTDGKMMVIEIKGEDSPMNRAKRDALALWVEAVNQSGGFGEWTWGVAYQPAEIHDLIGG